ncbi:uncharacterized protein N7484_008157 [Penicillium longicatenatum]|uniref:uncharacterized protein n=1 Tax=Penicillium longicatenatum TaxID=1561947 RepID=UPI002546CE6B|nr:uncharacterized protein N7484_008157 [Penicillium longicatenatum]KAJ5640295.1 hypothetical protein N7484_008157 [Penicillium longicatenatum]
MAYTTSYDGPNSGFQVGQNLGHITNQFPSLNQACLRDLRTTDPHHDKDRIQNTSGGLLKVSYWIFDSEEFQQWQNNQCNCLLWIRGDPGKGKTMLLCGIIDELQRTSEGTANISFFFCQATDVRINNATAVLRGLIYLLVKKRPSLLSYIQHQYDHAGKALFEDINAWNALLGIFMDILKDPTLRTTYLIIDALDECKAGLPSLLDLITRVSSTCPQVKWIVSSRNWPDIEERLDTTHATQISLELNEACISEAVRKFIQHKVRHLARVKKYSDETRDIIHHLLLSKSQDTFLWVALVCQDLDRTSRRHALTKLEAFPPGLNALYGRMIDQVCHSEDAELCKRILAVMSTVYRPITFDELVSLVELPNDLSGDSEALLEVIAICGSFLTVREDTIIFVHQSAKEFLLTETQNTIFPGGIEAEHNTVFSRCLEALFKTLRRDIFQLKYPGFLIEKVIPPSPNPLAAVKYACVYWVDHLQHSGCYDNDGINVDKRGYVGTFLEKKYLHWLEALSILGSLSQGIAAILKLEVLLQFKTPPDSFDTTGQQLKVVLFKICYQKERPDWIVNEPLLDKDWSACLQTLEGHSDSVRSIAWSPDGSRLASASRDTTIRIWNPATGQCASTFEGHRGLITSIAWSPDGSLLASGSWDDTVKIWDLNTGQCTSTLKAHSDLIASIVWSHDGRRLASASWDGTIKIWDTANNQCASTLEGHSRSVTLITWSQDESQLASASYDTTVRIWDMDTGQCALTLEGHSDLVHSVAWSPDGGQLASASSDKTIIIWDLTTGQYNSTLEGHSHSVTSITWSQNGSRLASASRDNTVRMWDPATGQCMSTLKGHGRSVTSIAWLQDESRLASASDDSTVRIWDLATGQCASILKGHSDSVHSVAWSPDRSQLATASSDKTIRIWDPAASQCTSTLKRHSSSVYSITWSQDGSQLASVSDDNTVRIWDPATGRCASTLKGHNHLVTSISWLQDGSRLASASYDKTVRIWDLTTGQCAFKLEGHSGEVHSIAWSQDQGRLASGSDDKTIRIWDLATGKCALILEGHSGSVHSIAWSRDGSRLASASFDDTVRIWDLTTGQCALNLEGHSNFVRSVIWSQDQGQLASGSDDKTIRIWDLATGKCALILEGHSGSVHSIAWSRDGSRLASASFDDTVRIWDLTTSQCESILHISSPYFIQFDESKFGHLHTSVGTFDISLTGTIMSVHNTSTLPDQYGYGLNGDHSWITYDGVNLLWLPAEYRPTTSSFLAISANKLAIACSSGLVMFLVLAKSPVPPL